MSRKAKKDYIWVCTSCRKVSSDLYGESSDTSKGWDASCVMNATQILKSRLVIENGIVVILDGKRILEQ